MCCEFSIAVGVLIDMRRGTFMTVLLVASSCTTTVSSHRIRDCWPLPTLELCLFIHVWAHITIPIPIPLASEYSKLNGIITQGNCHKKGYVITPKKAQESNYNIIM